LFAENPPIDKRAQLFLEQSKSFAKDTQSNFDRIEDFIKGKDIPSKNATDLTILVNQVVADAEQMYSLTMKDDFIFSVNKDIIRGLNSDVADIRLHTSAILQTTGDDQRMKIALAALAADNFSDLMTIVENSLYHRISDDCVATLLYRVNIKYVQLAPEQIDDFIARRSNLPQRLWPKDKTACINVAKQLSLTAES
jgi:hypothetical protein